MSFEKEMQGDINNFNNAVKEAVRVTAISGFGSIITASPVGNPDLWVYNHPDRGYIDYVGYLGKPDGYVGGSFRSNWFLSFNTPSQQVTDSTARSNNLSGEIASQINSLPYSDTYILSNNLPYSERLEAGHSTQAPNGIVGPVVSRLQTQIPRIIKQAERNNNVS